jgi:dihydrofolate reductase
VRFLLEHDLLDRLNLEVFPVIVGKGKRLFPEDGPDISLELLTSKTTPSGVQILTYRPAGRATYADVDDATTAEAAPKE